MAKYKLVLPRMGESVSEATIVKWLKGPGEYVDVDEAVVDIATDKVDSDVPSPVQGKLVERLFNENDVAKVGDVIAILEVEGEGEISSAHLSDDREQPEVETPTAAEDNQENENSNADTAEIKDTEVSKPAFEIPGADLLADRSPASNQQSAGRFYSPLVKNIAFEEGVSLKELDTISGSGIEGRVTKQDILDYIASKKEVAKPAPSISSGDEIIEMDRMRKLIADHMVSSVQTSPHVCSFIEVDVTNIVNWRNRVKNSFEKQEGTKITFTPIFIEAVAKAIRDYPMINISVSGSQIIKKRNINIGMAAALPSGNLIVPVIRNADQLNLVGITKVVNDLAARAKNNKLKPDETQGGTFTVTNVGSFGSLTGIPIINQPQVAILAIGAIIKKPAVIETEYGDVIAIRHKMMLSLSYDHRVVDGALGGMFLKRIAENLENWDLKREV